MAFDPKSLGRYMQVPLGAGDMQSKFLYGTPDAAAVCEAAGYFTDMRLRKGDIIESVMARNGTPVTKTYVVTAWNNATGVATVALQATAAG